MFLSLRGVTMFVLKYHVSSNSDSQQLRAFYRAIRAAMKILGEIWNECQYLPYELEP